MLDRMPAMVNELNAGVNLIEGCFVKGIQGECDFEKQ